jgi:hypothetical protein
MQITMKKISSRLLFMTKTVFPILWFGVLAIVLVTGIFGKAYEKNPMFLAMPIFMAFFGYFLMKKLVWDLVDEVFDCGDYLLVKNRGQEERVALSNVMNVSATTMVNPPRITLRLVNPGRFGTEIAFSPARPFTINPFAKNVVADDLILRVYSARPSHVS